MHAQINGIIPPLPGIADPPCPVVTLINFYLEAVHREVPSYGQACYTSTNYQDFLFHNPLFLAFCTAPEQSWENTDKTA
jgi:hypothetical protein